MCMFYAYLYTYIHICTFFVHIGLYMYMCMFMHIGIVGGAGWTTSVRLGFVRFFSSGLYKED